jgi:hypothetical protein
VSHLPALCLSIKITLYRELRTDHSFRCKALRQNAIGLNLQAFGLIHAMSGIDASVLCTELRGLLQGYNLDQDSFNPGFPGQSDHIFVDKLPLYSRAQIQSRFTSLPPRATIRSSRR